MPSDLRSDMERSTFSCTCFRSVLIASACEISCAYSSLYELIDSSSRPISAVMSAASRSFSSLAT